MFRDGVKSINLGADLDSFMFIWFPTIDTHNMMLLFLWPFEMAENHDVGENHMLQNDK